jgi:hypothetical protein
MPFSYLTKSAEEELRRLTQNDLLREDMRRVHAVKVATGDAYLQFVIRFHEFLSHRPRPFRIIQDRDMRL